MSILAIKKQSFDAMTGSAKSALSKAVASLTLGDPVVFSDPSGVAYYCWDDPRIGNGETWLQSMQPGVRAQSQVFIYGLPEGWAPVADT